MPGVMAIKRAILLGKLGPVDVGVYLIVASSSCIVVCGTFSLCNST
jgi:hypothetical protein